MTRGILTSALLVAAAALTARGADFPYMECNYSITCDCAFIHATAAHASVQCSCYGGEFSATLAGRSVPILSTIFCVNDTLQSTFADAAQGIAPAENVRYINGYYRKPHADRPDESFALLPYRDIWGAGSLSADASTMECVNLTADMLAMFYYAQTVDFGHMPQGVPHDTCVAMPDGSCRTLQITCNGQQPYMGRDVWNLTVNFTYGAGLSAYPITVLIDPAIGVPVEFAANIDIGRVVMTYTY